MKLKNLLILGAAFVLAHGAIAQAFNAQPVATAKATVITKNLDRTMQGAKIDEVLTTPFPGLFEIRIDKTIFYSNEAGTYIVSGRIFDTVNQRDMTKERIDTLNLFDFNLFAFSDALKIVNGKGERKVVVFEDPNCGYCKQFEKVLQNTENLTTYVFLMPILGDDSVKKSRNIWCSKDQKKAWTDWMARNISAPEVKDTKCDVSSFERNIATGKKLGLQGTPAIFFEDGTRQSGAMSAEDLKKKLNSVEMNKGLKK